MAEYTEQEARLRMLKAAVASGKATPEEQTELKSIYMQLDRQNQQGYEAATKKKAKGGSVKSSASRRADGIVQRGKTKGRMI